jgi:diadenosine tetraphosphate (Ap4A) HIT family hydrolase
MPHDPSCVFCQIIADTRKCVPLAEDPEARALMEIHPGNLRHCLVISKVHATDVRWAPAPAAQV